MLLLTRCETNTTPSATQRYRYGAEWFWLSRLLLQYVHRPLCLRCYFRGTETHKHTRIHTHSQVTTCAHACIGTYSHNVTHGAKKKTHTSTHTTSPDVVLERSLILSLSFTSQQPAQSVYPCLDKYTLAGGGVCFTHRVFWFN